MSFQGFQLGSTFSCGGLRLRSFHSLPGEERIWGKQTTNNKATGTGKRRNQATRSKPEFGAFWGFSSDSRISLPACCTTCVASEPASSTPAYLPELTPAAENIYWNCRYLQKWLVEQRLWVCHRFQTRSLHDFLILHTKVDASHKTNFLARQDGRTNSIFQRFGLLFFHEWRQALGKKHTLVMNERCQ